MNALSVTQLNTYVKSLLDRDEVLAEAVVRGELSGYKVYPSGHHYFTLKDEGGVLRCVMFRSDAVRLGFKPSDGMGVLACGRVSVYARDGVYQLYCRQLIPDGAGSLQMAFDELRRRLEAEGLFDVRHKKQLPGFPARVVLITSPAGAAVRDMIRILGRRWPLSEIILAPVRVQGEEAPEEIAAALRYVNAQDLGDVIIVGRGGGSIEDLWAFNDERVARAIFASHIPVISAVGHEPDVTIADFVADVRAATPTHAASLAVPDGEDWMRSLEEARRRLRSAVQNRLRLCGLRLEPLARTLRRPERVLADRRQRIDQLSLRLRQGWKVAIQPRRLWLAENAGRLAALNPRRVLERGYAMAEDEEGRLLRRAGDTAAGRTVSILLSDGVVKTRVEEVYEGKHEL